MFAVRGYQIFLAGRNTDELSRLAADITLRFSVPVRFASFDVTQLDTSFIFFEQVLATVGVLDGVLMAVGLMEATASMAELIAANFSGPALILKACADYFASRKRGFIIGLSSVAGDRGRRTNYVYGASKSALTTYLQGLRSQLCPYGVQVLTVKLGLIDTKMTFGTTYPRWLMLSPSSAAKKIVTAFEQKKETVYIPKRWRLIMWVLRLIPERIFKYSKI